MKKHNKLKRITAGLTALLMTGVLSSPLISLAAEDNPSGTTLNDLAAGDTMNYNYGVIFTNNGTVTNNGSVEDEGSIVINNGAVETNNGTIQTNGITGTVSTNNATIPANVGTVTTNNGTITTNGTTITTNKGSVGKNTGPGTITTNEGTITDNYGTVTENLNTIANNSGTVETNEEQGIIITNNGTVETNDGTIKTHALSKVETNNGTIEISNDLINTNNGTVEISNNQVTTNNGTIKTNNSTVETNNKTIENNLGTVNDNTGTIENNYGSVNGGSGTVENQHHEINLDNAPNVVLSGAEGEYSEINVKHYVLDGKDITISPATGYTIDSPPELAATCDEIINNNDGTYTVKGITNSGKLTVSTSPIPVDNITGVPSSMTEGETLTLSGTVEPSDAPNNTITWSVKDAGTTGATISGNVLSAATAGTVIITATIANGLGTADYTQDFTVTVKNKPVYAVTVIGGTGGTATANPASASAGTVITLTATADEGYEFTGWKVTAGTVTLTDPSSPSATFTMPSSAVTIEATFTPSEDTPTTDTPNTDTPSEDTPTTDTPNTDTPSEDTPTTDTPNTDTPSEDTPTTDTPNTDTPSGDTPSGDTPSTDTPSTDVPSTDAPSDDVPSTDTPNTDTPSVQTGRVVIGELTEVPDSLKDRFPTLRRLQMEMLTHILMRHGYTEGNTAFYDVKLQISPDNGKTWVAATEDNFPKEGITVTLPYPDGTGRATHDFAVAHMFTMTSERLGTTAGDVETPQVTELADGLQVTFKGLSPVSVSWKDAEVTSPKTGDIGAVNAIRLFCKEL